MGEELKEFMERCLAGYNLSITTKTFEEYLQKIVKKQETLSINNVNIMNSYFQQGIKIFEEILKGE